MAKFDLAKTKRMVQVTGFYLRNLSVKGRVAVKVFLVLLHGYGHI
jgi:hypothetical protein